MESAMDTEDAVGGHAPSVDPDSNGWGRIDLNTLSLSPAESQPPRRRSRRLSGVMPWSAHGMTLRRRGAPAALSPVERSLGALQLAAAADQLGSPRSAGSPAKEAAELLTAPATSRHSLAQLNTLPATAVAPRKSRRRSFGGVPAAAVFDADPPPQPGKENSCAPAVGVSAALGGDAAAEPPPPGAPSSDATRRTASKRGRRRSVGGAEVDAGRSGACSETSGDPSDSALDKTRRKGSNKCRRRSAGAGEAPASCGIARLEDIAPLESSAPMESSAFVEFGAPLESIASSESSVCTGSAEWSPPDRAVPAEPVPCAESAPMCRTPAVLPPELVEYYRNQNYVAPSDRPLTTIEEVASHLPPPRGLRRPGRGRGKVRQCVFDVTPAKERLRHLKALRVNRHMKRRAPAARPKQASKLLDARLKELDSFHRDWDARNAFHTSSPDVSAPAVAGVTPAAGVTRTNTSRPTSTPPAAPPDADAPSAPSAPLPFHLPVSMSGASAVSSASLLPPAECMEAEVAVAGPAAAAWLQWEGEARPSPPHSTWQGPPEPCTPARAFQPPGDELDVSVSSGLWARLEMTETSVESLDSNESAPRDESPVISGGGALPRAATDEDEPETPRLNGPLDDALLGSPSVTDLALPCADAQQCV